MTSWHESIKEKLERKTIMFIHNQIDKLLFVFSYELKIVEIVEIVVSFQGDALAAGETHLFSAQFYS